jgi:hypothetical protein
VFAAPMNANLEWSDDGTTWTTVVSKYFGSAWIKEALRSILETNPTDGSARVWDCVVNSNYGSTVGCLITECEHVFAGADIAPTTLSSNGDGPQGRTTTNGDSFNSRPVSEAFNDVIGGDGWRARVNGFGAGDHFGIVYPEPKGPLTKMRIYQQGITQDPQSVTTRYSHDGLNFVNLSTTVLPSSAGWHDVTV